jgi:hypothetical protein
MHHNHGGIINELSQSRDGAPSPDRLSCEEKTTINQHPLIFLMGFSCQESYILCLLSGLTPWTMNVKMVDD